LVEDRGELLLGGAGVLLEHKLHRGVEQLGGAVHLQDIARGIVARDVDAIVFTSQVQWKHLTRVASDLGLAEAVVQALNTDVVVASVGPVCSAALAEAGVVPRVVPENPKMGPLVAALAQYFSAYVHTGGG